VRKFTESRVRSFGHAFQGWWYVLRTQRNAWLHVIIALVVFALSLWLCLDAFQWSVVLLTTAMVFAAEFFNTAIEALVDLSSPQEHPQAKIAKDVAASAVLITAMGAVIIGILVLGPPFLERADALMAR
jgi:diacylglycerol kinase